MASPFDPIEFFRVAQDLAGSTEEAKLRTAIGRTYYTLFLIAREKVGVKDRKNAHQKVISAVKRKNRSVGDQLDMLRILRTVADYELSPRDPGNRDWIHNWSRVANLYRRLLPKVQSL